MSECNCRKCDGASSIEVAILVLLGLWICGVIKCNPDKPIASPPANVIEKPDK